MFFRQKKSGNRVYLQIVENRWEDGRSKQRVIATLGRLDQLQQTGQLEGLLRSERSSANRSCCWPLIDAVKRSRCVPVRSDRP